MKQSHKFKTLGNVQSIIASCRTASEAARKLGVHRASVTRWVKAGRVTLPASSRPTDPGRTPRQPSSDAAPIDPSAWGDRIRELYDLTITEAQLLALAIEAARMCYDRTLSPATRLTAMSRYQALVRDLNLEHESGATETYSGLRQFPRRA